MQETKKIPFFEMERPGMFLTLSLYTLYNKNRVSPKD